MSADKTAAQSKSSEVVTGQDITSLVESIKAMTPPRKVRFNEFKTRSVFNPTGNRNRKLTCTVYQNGARVNPALLFDEEIKLLNNLPTGRFVEKIVTVRKVDGRDGAKDQLHIEYSNRSHDQRIAVAKHIRSFVGLLRQIHEEAKAGANVED